MLTVEIDPRVPPSRRRILKALAERLARAARLTNDLTIHFVRADEISTGTGVDDQGYAVFCEGINQILIALGEEEYFPWATVADHLAHELGHYCQWRDGRAYHEAGATRRGRNFLKRD